MKQQGRSITVITCQRGTCNCCCDAADLHEALQQDACSGQGQPSSSQNAVDGIMRDCTVGTRRQTETQVGCAQVLPEHIIRAGYHVDNNRVE